MSSWMRSPWHEIHSELLLEMIQTEVQLTPCPSRKSTRRRRTKSLWHFGFDRLMDVAFTTGKSVALHLDNEPDAQDQVCFSLRSADRYLRERRRTPILRLSQSLDRSMTPLASTGKTFGSCLISCFTGRDDLRCSIASSLACTSRNVCYSGKKHLQV